MDVQRSLGIWRWRKHRTVLFVRSVQKFQNKSNTDQGAGANITTNTHQIPQKVNKLSSKEKNSNNTKIER